MHWQQSGEGACLPFAAGCWSFKGFAAVIDFEEFWTESGSEREGDLGRDGCDMASPSRKRETDGMQCQLLIQVLDSSC